ncbi:uncharacterized protein LOC110035956 [Phalaenopsis equestris]|uniref:uncharacterized protein LOC110035956 n=1 Tax=Phalaenopsis equestris TaxID=78828 RepID=UPI0009E2129E|nr:uncharacterized protein LOC110035956 [Phalaenopsis equestris]
MWTLHPHFVEVVGKVWRSEGDTNPWTNMWKLQKKVAAKLKKWNWHTIGNIHDNLIKAQSKVLNMEDCFQRGLISEVDLHQANEELLLHTSYTECFLKQKAVVTKFMEEDRNSSYYHACINFRRKDNMIISIQDSAGHMLTDAENIVQDAVNYFQNIFKEQSPSRAQIMMEIFSDCKDYVHNLNLNTTPLEGEIKAALDFIDDHKVAGPDRFTTKFYKATWNIICGEFVSVGSLLRVC